MYTSILKVREFSGLDDSTNVPDSVVKGKVTIAQSMFNGAVARRYRIPLPYRRQNSIVFSGTGSGAGTLTAVVNGTSYAITISSGLTASQAAALMLTAMQDSADFYVELFPNDSSTNDAVVVIISKGDSDSLATANAQVNIANAGGTAAGITGTAGTRLDRYPGLVDQAVAEMAAALLLNDNYGAEGQDSGKDGKKRMEAVYKLLTQLQGKDDEMPDLILIDDMTGEELPQSGGLGPTGYPNPTSDADAVNPTSAKVTMNQIF